MMSDPDQARGRTGSLPRPSTDDHSRSILGESLVYPVISRRSGGLSIGINLFPDRKTCNFDCPYCEVFPADDNPVTHTTNGADRDPEVPGLTASLSRDLDDFFDRIYPETFEPEPVRDLCISGDGEPTLSPDLETCLVILESARSRYPGILAKARTVIITNSTGFLKTGVIATLSRFSGSGNLDIWAKLDAGTPETFSLMSGSIFHFDDVLKGLLDFSRNVPVIIQSMICQADGFNPGIAEFQARAEVLGGLAARGGKIREVHLYTVARPASHQGVRPVADSTLLDAAGIIASALPGGIPVKAFGPEGLIP